jgi:hypothetical protein
MIPSKASGAKEISRIIDLVDTALSTNAPLPPNDIPGEEYTRRVLMNLRAAILHHTPYEPIERLLTIHQEAIHVE